MQNIGNVSNFEGFEEIILKLKKIYPHFTQTPSLWENTPDEYIKAVNKCFLCLEKEIQDNPFREDLFNRKYFLKKICLLDKTLSSPAIKNLDNRIVNSWCEKIIALKSDIGGANEDFEKVMFFNREYPPQFFNSINLDDKIFLEEKTKTFLSAQKEEVNYEIFQRKMQSFLNKVKNELQKASEINENIIWFTYENKRYPIYNLNKEEEYQFIGSSGTLTNALRDCQGMEASYWDFLCTSIIDKEHPFFCENSNSVFHILKIPFQAVCNTSHKDIGSDFIKDKESFCHSLEIGNFFSVYVDSIYKRFVNMVNAQEKSGELKNTSEETIPLNESEITEDEILEETARAPSFLDGNSIIRMILLKNQWIEEFERKIQMFVNKDEQSIKCVELLRKAIKIIHFPRCYKDAYLMWFCNEIVSSNLIDKKNSKMFLDFLMKSKKENFDLRFWNSGDKQLQNLICYYKEKKFETDEEHDFEYNQLFNDKASQSSSIGKELKELQSRYSKNILCNMRKNPETLLPLTKKTAHNEINFLTRKAQAASVEGFLLSDYFLKLNNVENKMLANLCEYAQARNIPMLYRSFASPQSTSNFQIGQEDSAVSAHFEKMENERGIERIKALEAYIAEQDYKFYELAKLLFKTNYNIDDFETWLKANIKIIFSAGAEVDIKECISNLLKIYLGSKEFTICLEDSQKKLQPLIKYLLNSGGYSNKFIFCDYLHRFFPEETYPLIVELQKKQETLPYAIELLKLFFKEVSGQKSQAWKQNFFKEKDQFKQSDREKIINSLQQINFSLCSSDVLETLIEIICETFSQTNAAQFPLSIFGELLQRTDLSFLKTKAEALFKMIEFVNKTNPCNTVTKQLVKELYEIRSEIEIELECQDYEELLELNKYYNSKGY